MPYEARIKAARALLGALSEVVQGRVPASAALPVAKPAAPPPKAAMPAKKNVFGRSMPPAPKGVSTRPIPFPGRWKR